MNAALQVEAVEEARRHGALGVGEELRAIKTLGRIPLQGGGPDRGLLFGLTREKIDRIVEEDWFSMKGSDDPKLKLLVKA